MEGDLKQVSCASFEEFEKAADEHKASENVFWYFISNNDESTGEAWCPDCRKAKPVVDEAFAAHAPKPAVLITTICGERCYWNDQQNPFRTSDLTKITGVPTLLRVSTGKRLGDDECQDPEKVKALLAAA